MADRGSGGDPVNFVAHFAFLLPVIVLCDLVGIPQADRETFRPLATDLAACPSASGGGGSRTRS